LLERVGIESAGLGRRVGAFLFGLIDGGHGGFSLPQTWLGGV
jgi:hypothetical protein